MLTRQQSSLLTHLNEQISAHNICPSFDEMRAALGLKSKSSVHRLIRGLEERGYIRRLPNRARALEILRIPEAALAEICHIPLHGTIAAGTPREAIHDTSKSIAIPATMIGKGAHYALRVEGESMINAGIQDGDTVIIKHTTTAAPGTVVVALVDGEEVTLKTYAPEEGNITLRAANDDFADRTYPAERVQIQGILTGLLRNY